MSLSGTDRPRVVEVLCEGAPRDMGRSQGAACREVLLGTFQELATQARFAHRLGHRDAHTARVARDFRRHFPHQAETLEGIARGAGVPASWLARQLAFQAAGLPPRMTRGSVAVASRRSERGVPSASYLAARIAPQVVVRSSRPDGCHRSVEVTVPWLTSALAGVNEAGLGVVCIPGGGSPGNCAAPALLLVNDCLARFGSIEAALDWCLARPTGGRAKLLIGDESGEVAGIEIMGDECRVLRPANGLLVDAGGAEYESEVAKQLSERPLGAVEELEALLSNGTPANQLVVLDPADRRLGLCSPEGGSKVRWMPA